jgi:hypothetical protein
MSQPNDQDPGRDPSIDAALRRLFEPPADAGRGLVPPAAPETGAEAAPRPVPWRWVALAAAAAVLLVLGRGWIGDDAPPPEPDRDLAGPALGPLAPPDAPFELTRLLPGDRLSDVVCDGVQRPDLETLYAEAALAPQVSISACSSTADLEQTLAQRHDSPVALEAGAGEMLHGPIAAPQWPTGTVLTGYPDGRPALLVAESDANVDCCLALDLPASSQLRLFPWRMGNTVFYEITPLDRPYLLELITAYR